MMFRDGFKVDLPRIQTEKQVAMARLQDMKKKEDRKKDVNAHIGDKVLLRNYLQIKMFEPYFIPEPSIIEDVNKFKVMVKREHDGLRLTSQPDDLKLFKGDYQIVDNQHDVTEEGNAEAWDAAFENLEETDENGEVCGAVENTQDRHICQRRQNL